MFIADVLKDSGYTFAYHDDECSNVFYKDGTEEYMTGYFINDTTVNLCLHSSFYNEAHFEGDVDKFVADFEAHFDRLWKEYTAE